MVETERRKTHVDVRNCVPIRFGDGQTWYVPKPRRQYYPIVHQGRACMAVRLTYGAAHDALLHMIAEATDDEMRLAALATMASRLLCANYDLAEEELDQVLSFGEPDWLKFVALVAAGRYGFHHPRS